MIQSSKKRVCFEKSVSFGSVQVREFQRIAGEHPDATDGPALSIGWKYVQKRPTQISEQTQDDKPSEKLLPLNGETRRFILSHVFNVSKKNIDVSERLAEKARRQRRETYREWLLQQEKLANKSTEKEFRFEKMLKSKSFRRRSSGLNSPLKRRSSFDKRKSSPLRRGSSFDQMKSRLNNMQSFLRTSISRLSDSDSSLRSH